MEYTDESSLYSISILYTQYFSLASVGFPFRNLISACVAFKSIPHKPFSGSGLLGMFEYKYMPSVTRVDRLKRMTIGQRNSFFQFQRSLVAIKRAVRLNMSDERKIPVPKSIRIPPLTLPI